MEKFKGYQAAAQSITTSLFSFLQSSIIGKCGQFPNEISCNFHVTQQRAEVEPHLQSFVKSNPLMYSFPRLAGMIDWLSHSTTVCILWFICFIM